MPSRKHAVCPAAEVAGWIKGGRPIEGSGALSLSGVFAKDTIVKNRPAIARGAAKVQGGALPKERNTHRKGEMRGVSS